jgi:hypothetical protein
MEKKNDMECPGVAISAPHHTSRLNFSPSHLISKGDRQKLRLLGTWAVGACESQCYTAYPEITAGKSCEICTSFVGQVHSYRPQPRASSPRAVKTPCQPGRDPFARIRPLSSIQISAAGSTAEWLRAFGCFSPLGFASKWSGVLVSVSPRLPFLGGILLQASFPPSPSGFFNI